MKRDLTRNPAHAYIVRIKDLKAVPLKDTKRNIVPGEIVDEAEGTEVALVYTSVPVNV